MELRHVLGVTIRMRLTVISAPMLFFALSGQERARPPAMASPLIDRTKPSVYWIYRDYKPLTSNQGVIRLEFRNNTRWRIDGHGVSDNNLGGTGGWCYSVTTDDACHTPLWTSNCSDMAGPVELGPGSSILMNIDTFHLSRGSAIEVTFYFGWERNHDIHHFVRFGFSALPSGVQQAVSSLDVSPRPRPACVLPDKSRYPPMPLPLPPPLSTLGQAASPFTAPPPAADKPPGSRQR